MHIKGSIAVTTALLTSMAASPAIVTEFAGTNPQLLPMTSEDGTKKVDFLIEGPTTGLGEDGWYIEGGKYITVSSRLAKKEIQPDPDPEHVNYFEVYLNGVLYKDLSGATEESPEGKSQFALGEQVFIPLDIEGKTTVQLKAHYWESSVVETEAGPKVDVRGISEDQPYVGEPVVPGAPEVEEPEVEEPEVEEPEVEEPEIPEVEEPEIPEVEEPATPEIEWKKIDVSSDSVDFFLDTKSPEITEVSLKGKYRDLSGVIYASSSLDVDVSKVTPSLSGIKEYQLIEGDAIIARSTSPQFTLEKNAADLSVRAVGGNGKVSTTYPILDKLIFVGKAPGVALSESKPGYSKDDTTWYDAAPSVLAKVIGNHIESVTATVNGEPADLELKMSSKSEEVYEVHLPEGLPAYDVSVTAVDKLGQETTETTSFKIDSTKPLITDFSVSGVFHNQDGKTFISGNGIDFSIDLEDTESGIAKVSLLRDGGTFLSNTDTSSVTYTLTENGTYSVYLEDNVGNNITVPLSEITGGELEDQLVSKTTAPNLEIQVPETAITNEGKLWFASLPEVGYSVEDALLKNYTVTVNGKEVATGEQSGNYLLNLKEAEVNPNAVDGSLEIVVTSSDVLGNSSIKTQTIYIDSFAPVIKKFNFTIPGFEGKEIGGGSEYGIFLDGATQGFVEVEDLGPSSGLKAVQYLLIDGDSGEVLSTDTAVIHGNIATLRLPSNFKGYLKATASDNVGNLSAPDSPSGLISGPSNFHINNANIDITLPETPYTDGTGLPLYSAEGAGKVSISGSRMGIRSISWGVGTPGENVQGRATVSFDGVLEGEGGYSIAKTDKNLVNAVTGGFNLQGNSNGLQIWVTTTDRAGFESTSVKQYSIDSTAPELSVSFNQTDESGFYNSTRVATLTVKDDNFTPEGVSLTGEAGEKGGWSQGENGLWTSTLTFAQDGEYAFKVEVTDRAQNKSLPYASETFTIDKTAPTIAVAWDGQQPAEGNFYPKARIADISVVEKNFDPGLVAKTGTGTLSGWGRSGDVNSATVTFAEDGPQEFSISVKDKANNQSETYDSGKFYVHTETPKITVSGVSPGTSYHRGVGLDVTVEDKFLLKPEVSLTTRGGQTLDLESTFSDGKAYYHLDELPKDIALDDLYTLDIKAENKAGTVSESATPFIVNRFGSQYSFLNEDYLGKFHQSAEDVSIQEFSVEPLDLENVRLEVSRDSGEVSFSKELTQSEMLSDDNYVHTFMKEIFEKEGDGVYNLAVYSSTNGGTLDNASVSQEYTFVLDTTSPTVIVSGVKGGATYNTSEQRGTVEVRDAYGLEDVEVLVNGRPVEEIQGHPGLYEFFLTEGKDQTVMVTAVDRAGNETILDESGITLTTNVWEYFWNTPWGRALLLTGVGALVVLGIVGVRRWSQTGTQSRKTAAWHEKAIIDSSSSAEASNRITSLED